MRKVRTPCMVPRNYSRMSSSLHVYSHNLASSSPCVSRHVMTCLRHRHPWRCQDDGDENIVSIGCGWFRWGNCSGGEYDNGGARRSRFRSFVSEPGGGRRPSVTRSGGSGRGGILLRQHPTRREVDSEDDGDNDASTVRDVLYSHILLCSLCSTLHPIALHLCGFGAHCNLSSTAV